MGISDISEFDQEMADFVSRRIAVKNKGGDASPNPALNETAKETCDDEDRDTDT